MYRSLSRCVIHISRNRRTFRCADLVDKPHICRKLADVQAPGYPTSLNEHPAAWSMGFAPTTNSLHRDLQLWRQIEFPGTNGNRCLRWGWRRSTTGLPEKLLSREHGAGPGLSGFDTDLVLGPRVDHGWEVWATCSTSAASMDPTHGFWHGGRLVYLSRPEH